MPVLPGDEAFQAARLVQWGLRPQARPVQEPEYRRLIHAYHDGSEFRATVHGIAEGLGLSVLDASEHGLVLAAQDDSPFSLRPADFRRGQHAADTRLLDGLAQVAIATTVFPRARDLDEDPDLARPPITIAEVEAQLDRICEGLAQAARDEGDPMASDERRGLTEAWRVYRRHLPTLETKDSRQAARSTRRIVAFALERLRDFGCFVQVPRTGEPIWQPTHRYQIMVQRVAASELYELVQEALAAAAATPPDSKQATAQSADPREVR